MKLLPNELAFLTAALAELAIMPLAPAPPVKAPLADHHRAFIENARAAAAAAMLTQIAVDRVTTHNGGNFVVNFNALQTGLAKIILDCQPSTHQANA